jgi:cytochrome c peroxidase
MKRAAGFQNRIRVARNAATRFYLLLLLGVISVSAPAQTTEAFNEKELRSILRLSPLPPPPADPSNAHSENPAAARFGRRLFFDPRLSASGTMSCASCHDPARAWSDGQRHVDTQVLFPRNVPSLRNSAYNRWFYWDGRADSAWSQALGPLENDSEMASSRLALLHLIRTDPKLSQEYHAIFGTLPEGADDLKRFPLQARPVHKRPEHPLQQAWTSMTEADRHTANRVFTNIGKAIAAFERGIMVGETAFDRYVVRMKQGDISASKEFPLAAMRGMKLFVGRGECTLCHSGPNFSDGEFHDVGIALGVGQRVDPARHRGALTLLLSPFTRVGEYADAETPYAPVQYLDAVTHQLGQFKTPTLRGVAETAPYMHDGRFDSLHQVVRFYSTRDGASPLGHPTTLLKPLGLSETEVDDLVAFLHTLGAGDTGAAALSVDLHARR